jgi:Zn-dependent M28 family amino/carboxypeptidase
LMIVGFGAEEQGLVGSNELAQRMLDDGDDIIGMYAADMIGYRVPGRNIQVGLPIVSHTPSMTSKLALSSCAHMLIWVAYITWQSVLRVALVLQLSRRLPSTCTFRRLRLASTPGVVLTTCRSTIVDTYVYSCPVVFCVAGRDPSLIEWTCWTCSRRRAFSRRAAL